MSAPGKDRAGAGWQALSGNVIDEERGVLRAWVSDGGWACIYSLESFFLKEQGRSLSTFMSFDTLGFCSKMTDLYS